MKSLPLLAFVVACLPAPAARSPVEPAGGAIEHRMRNCPSVLPNVQTYVADEADGVAVTITTADPESQSRLLSLARLHARIGAAPEVEFPEHSGMHGGPGTYGHCPIVHVGTIVSFTEIPYGVRFHVRATQPDTVDALRRETHARADRLPKWVREE